MQILEINKKGSGAYSDIIARKKQEQQKNASFTLELKDELFWVFFYISLQFRS